LAQFPMRKLCTQECRPRRIGAMSGLCFHTNNGLISEAPECNHIIVLKPGPAIGMVDNILVEGNVAVVL
jgi:hypothetical protein